MAGTFTDVVDIVAPNSAVAGESVPVTIKIRNISSSYIHVSAVGVYDSEERFIDWPDAWIGPGLTHSFSGSFIMPNKAVTIHAYSWYEDIYGYWNSDDEAARDVSLAEVFEGTITKKELDYEDRWQAVPIYNIPTGTRVRVRITGRNDMASNQKMGAWWQVKDPDGVVVDEYREWETYWTGPGNEQVFRGGSFDLDKAGTYTLIIALSMNPSDPVIVDDYYGNLCTVEAAVPEPSFRRFDMTRYITA
ncbi:hypothetical protein ES705_32198 [subsurface metagenome]